MKSPKWIVVIVVAALIGVGVGFGAWFAMKPSVVTGNALAEMLPADTLLAVELIDLAGTIEKVKTGRLGLKMKEMDVVGVMQTLGVPAEDIEKFRQVKDQVMSITDSLLFKEFFARDTILAVLPLNISQKDDPKEFLRSIVLVSRTKYGGVVAELVNLIALKQTATQSSKYYEYDIIQIITEEEISVYYTIVDDVMITAFDLETIKICLELIAHPQASLAYTGYYRDLFERLFSKDSTTFFFCNTQKLYDNLVQNIKTFEDEKDVTKAVEGLKHLNTFNAVGYSSYDNDSSLMNGKWIVMFDKDRMSPGYKKIYSVQAEENKTLGMIPEDSMVYYWANSLEPSMLVELYLDELNLDDTALNSIEKEFLASTGISLDKALNAFGNQACFLIRDLKIGGQFPIPMLGILLQAEDSDTVEALLGVLVQQTQMVLEEEQVDDVTIKYIALPFGSDIQPAYAFYKGFCIIAINRQLLKEIIATDKSGNSIVTAQAFKDVNKGLTDKMNGITFVRTEILLDRIKALAEWGKNMLGIMEPDAVEKGTVVLNDVVYPLLDGLKMYKAVGTCTVISNNEIAVNVDMSVER